MSAQIGNSAARKNNVLWTWAEAREFLDRRFAQFRYEALQDIEDDNPCAAAVALRVINGEWQRTKLILEQALLPRRRVKRYEPTRTVSPTCAGREKVLYRDSELARTRHGLVSERRKKGKNGKPARSHHKGTYVSDGKRGRPRTTSLLPVEEQREKRRKQRASRAAKARAATAARRRESGLKPYAPRRAPEVVARERAKKAARTERIRAARRAITAELKGQRWRFKDDRKNHDVRYAYEAPKPRQRATAKQLARKRPQRFKRTAPVRLDGDDLEKIVKRRLKSDAARAKHMRGYWRRVRMLAR